MTTHHPEDDDDGSCPQCGGEGVVMLSECPGEWGEDTFADVDREIACPTCRGKAA